MTKDAQFMLAFMANQEGDIMLFVGDNECWTTYGNISFAKDALGELESLGYVWQESLGNSVMAIASIEKKGLDYVNKYLSAIATAFRV